MRRIVAVVVGGLLLSVVGCTKTVYVATTDAPAAPTSTIIPTTTVVSFSNDLRKAAASCLDSMPELRLWDSPIGFPGLERNVEECREFRILGLAEKTDSSVLDALTLDLDEHLSTVEYIIYVENQCDKAAEDNDPYSSLKLGCNAITSFAKADSSVKRQRASRITQNLQALLSQ